MKQETIHLDINNKKSKYFLNTLQELKRNLDNFGYYKNKSDLNELIDLFTSIEVVLGQIDEYEKEFHYYSRMKIMSVYILENNLDNLKFVKEMLNSFYNLITFKNYDKFTSKLIEWEQYFYTEIYTPSNGYDEENLAKIINGLLN